MTLNWTHALVAGGSSLLQKILNQQNLNHSFWPLLEFCHFRGKKSYHYYFLKGKSNFLQVLDSEPRFWKRFLGFVVKPWHTMSDIDQNTSYSYKILRFWKFFSCPEVTKLHFRKWQNLESYLQGAFTLHLLVELIHNGTNAKEKKKIRQVNAFKKEPQS